MIYDRFRISYSILLHVGLLLLFPMFYYSAMAACRDAPEIVIPIIGRAEYNIRSITKNMGSKTVSAIRAMADFSDTDGYIQNIWTSLQGTASKETTPEGANNKREGDISEHWKKLFLSDKELCDEVSGVASQTGMLMEDVYAANAYYEARWNAEEVALRHHIEPRGNMAVSSVIAALTGAGFTTNLPHTEGQTFSDRGSFASLRVEGWYSESIFHTSSIVRNSSIVVTYSENGYRNYSMVTMAGLSLAQTYWNEWISISIDARPGTGTTANDVAQNMISGKSSPLAVGRIAIRECKSIKCAISVVQSSQLTSPTYFTIVSDSDAVVLAMGTDSVDDIRWLTSEYDSGERTDTRNKGIDKQRPWFLYQSSSQRLNANVFESRDSAIISLLSRRTLPFTLEELARLPWGSDSYPLRSEDTIRVTFLYLVQNRHYTTVTSCSVVDKRRISTSVQPTNKFDNYYCSTCCNENDLCSDCVERIGVCVAIDGCTSK